MSYASNATRRQERRAGTILRQTRRHAENGRRNAIAERNGR